MKKQCRGSKGRFVKCSSKSAKKVVRKTTARRPRPTIMVGKHIAVLPLQGRDYKGICTAYSASSITLRLANGTKKKFATSNLADISVIGSTRKFVGSNVHHATLPNVRSFVSIPPSDEVLRASGWSDADIRRMKAKAKRKAGRTSGKPIVTSSYSLRKGTNRIVFSYFDRDKTGPLIRMYSTKRIDGQNVDKILTQRQAQNKIADLQIYGWR
jgi:hypothetical protein